MSSNNNPTTISATTISSLADVDTHFSNDAVMESLRSATPVYWKNPHCTTFDEAINDVGLGYDDVIDASDRLNRFAPFIETIFPETKASKGIIESPFYRTEKLQKALNITQGQLYVKADNQLPISGSIKARGGIYEVLQFAEGLALEHKLLTLDDDYSKLASPELKEFFSAYSIAVGSTGNLGLSIGIMSAKLGFNASVHMSSDAKQWKKDKLRAHGVQVVEYEGDYGEAVTNGRKQAENDPYTYFVDDENSKDLFLGYAVAGLRLKKQFDEQNIVISKAQPLIVYLPCGVGGGPGGVAFGLKLAFNDNVHCVFAEPVQSPCMMLGVYTGLHDEISVNDIGLTNHTVADGLAVGRASGFIGKAMQRSLDAFYTKTDTEMFQLLKLAYETEQLKLEPSASIGFAGVPYYANTHGNDDVKHDNIDNLDNAIHLVWATGGNMMPDDEFQACLSKG